MAALLLVAPSALAQRVLLVEPDPRDKTLSEAFNRLRAELLLQEFEVGVIEASEPVSPQTLEDEAQRAGAFAGILLARSPGGAMADVCIADRVTGKISQRRLAITEARDAPRVLAVRAVDLLRASLRELPPGERPPPEVVGVQEEPPARVQAWSAPPPRFRLSAFGTAFGVASELGTAFGGSVGLSYRPVPWLAAGLVVTGPLIGAQYDASVGTAFVRQEVVLASGAANVLGEGAFELGPTLAAGLYRLQAHAEVEAPFRSRSDEVISFAASAGVEAGLHVSGAVVLSGSLALLLLTPRPIVAVGSDEATVAAPVAMGSLGMGVAF